MYVNLDTLFNGLDIDLHEVRVAGPKGLASNLSKPAHRMPPAAD